MTGNIFVQSWLIWATFYFCFIKRSLKLWFEECSYKTVSKNAEAAVRKCSSDIVTQRCCVKNVFLEILENSQENTRARVFLLIKLHAPVSACNFIKKDTLVQMFSCEFCEISKNTFSYRTSLVAASSSSKQVFLKISWYSQGNICVEVPF